MRKKRNIVNIQGEQFRRIQLIQLEMLLEFRRICRLYDIHYSLDGGTLLGAVRHKGFIPWDPDIDVIMLREDYELFFRAAQMELDTERFFLQEYRTDKYYRWGYSRLRRNNTEFIRAGQEHMKFRTGIFMDIMIVDNVPDVWIGRWVNNLMCFIIRKGLWSESGRLNAKTFAGRKICRLMSFIPANFWFELRHKIYSHNNKKRTELIRRMTGVYPSRCRYGTKRDYYDHFTKLEFEGYYFDAFSEYDRYLRDVYGDYMVLPPIEKRVSHIPAVKVQVTTPNLPPVETSERR